MANRSNAARSLSGKPTIIPDVDPPFQVVLSPTLTGAMSWLDTVHRAGVLLKVERIAELAGWGNLRGGGRFTVDSADLLESIHVVYEVDALSHRILFTSVEEPRF